MEIPASFGLNQFIHTSTHELGAILVVIVAPEDSPLDNIAVDDIGLSDETINSCCGWSI